jgi:hypothetical protein
MIDLVLIAILTNSCCAPQQTVAVPTQAVQARPVAEATSVAPVWGPLIVPEPVSMSAPASPPPPVPPEFGIQIHGCGPQSPDEAIDLAARASFSWIKQQVRWDEIEGVRGAYAWKCIDDVVGLAQSRGLKVLLSVTTAPRWARTWTAGEPGPPDADLLAGFLAGMAKRYTGRIHAVEVFNEPNLVAEWGDHLNPRYYVRMLIAASQSIKRIDANILIISAGLAPTRWNDWGTAIDDLEYLRQIGPSAAYDADCIGAHFNDGTSSPLIPDSPFEQLMVSYQTLTSQSKPICLTEFGIAAPVNGKTPKGFQWASKTTPEQQAQWLVEGVRWAKAHPGILKLAIIWNLNYYSDEGDPNSLYALWTPMGMRPAYDALRAAMK